MNRASPEVTEGLLYYGLITQEQADEANHIWDIEMVQFFADDRWWQKTAEIAWKNTTPWLRRWWDFGTAPWLWKYQWIKEKRGW